MPVGKLWEPVGQVLGTRLAASGTRRAIFQPIVYALGNQYAAFYWMANPSLSRAEAMTHQFRVAHIEQCAYASIAILAAIPNG